MKLSIFALTLLFSPVLFATTAKDVKTKTTEAAEAAADYSVEQKEAFQQNMQKEMDEMSAEIARMKSVASQKTGAAKADMKEKIEALEKKQAEFQKDFRKLKKSSGKAWSEMKSGMSAAWGKVSESYKKAKAEFAEEK
jgi:leucyl aminopeptidase (aminopeptidase T)